jgi:cation:H+ antiporter
MTWILIIAGFAALMVGGELLVGSAVTIARRLGISPLVIGLTLVGFGTSTPELLTSLRAAGLDAPGIAVGNVIGSNIANILLILGVTALICPVSAATGALRRDGTALVVATVLCAAVVLVGRVDFATGLVFVAGLVLFVVTTWLSERRSADASAALHTAEGDAAIALPTRLPLAMLGFVGGLLLTLLGARLLVDGSISLARAFGVSETVIGLTIVAVGTSLPELVTSVMAALRRQSDVALGNVIGSNIFNVLGILGITALVEPIVVPADIGAGDVAVLCAATGAMLLAALTGQRVSRREGGLLLAGYGGYLWLLL